MRDRYLRHILPNIDKYEISDEKRLLLTGQLNYTEGGKRVTLGTYLVAFYSLLSVDFYVLLNVYFTVH
jgi:hypothetical protein